MVASNQSRRQSKVRLVRSKKDRCLTLNSAILHFSWHCIGLDFLCVAPSLISIVFTVSSSDQNVDFIDKMCSISGMTPLTQIYYLKDNNSESHLFALKYLLSIIVFRVVRVLRICGQAC
jgi:hypothetical protein